MIERKVLLFLGTRYELQDSQFLTLITDNHDVKHVSQQKLLALHIDDKYFTSHIAGTCPSVPLGCFSGLKLVVVFDLIGIFNGKYFSAIL